METLVETKREIQLKNNEKYRDEDDWVLKNQPFYNFYRKTLVNTNKYFEIA